MNTMNRVRFVFPQTKDFAEDAPRVLWQDLYGWIDGYGMLFDPVVLKVTGVLPEWENGPQGPAGEGDFIVCPCPEASAAFAADTLPPGLFIRPPGGGERRISEKEWFENPVFSMNYPDRLAFEAYPHGLPEWRIAERTVVEPRGQGLAIGFDPFQLSVLLTTPDVHWHERRLTVLADMLACLLKAAGVTKVKAGMDIPERLDDLRIDFQAYGINRFLLQRLLILEGRSKAAVATADRFIMSAFHAFRDGNAERVAAELKKGFEELREVRRRVAGVEMRFLDVPHIGILLEEKAFFEFEWPRLSMEVLESYWRKAETQGYRLAVEAGASCWEKLAKRYPAFARRFRDRLQASDSLELTNGTYSLPYALLSPLAMQYMQFAQGQATFRQLFGVAPTTYQCQENSLTPQMPELLRHFGYDYALHITQNHGSAPSEEHDFIRWTSPAGHALPAACSPADDPLGRMHRMGSIFYLFLPEVVSHFKQKAEQLYVNFQDLGYVSWRVHMVRAHRYADVWGRFQTPRDTRPTRPEALPAKTYAAETYNLGANVFYGNSTNLNAFSHYEDVFGLFAGYRRLKFMGPEWSDDALQKTLCFLEAHDCSIVAGQRRGEFYAGSPMNPSPYSRDTLVTELEKIKRSAAEDLDGRFATLQPTCTTRLYNASEVELAFAHVVQAGSFAGTGLIGHNGRHYAAGRFPAFGAGPCQAAPAPVAVELPVAANGWEAQCHDDWIQLARNGKPLRFRVRDKRIGSFSCVSQAAQTWGELTILTFKFELESDGVYQAVKLDTLFSGAGNYAEIDLTYAPRNDFVAADKWGDHLCLEFDGGRLERLVQFNPNVYGPSSRDRIASPYGLTLHGRCGTFGLLNEGAFVYGVDRKANRVHWLFHVDGEGRRQRRMALNFGDQDPFLLARAWGAGLVPYDGQAGVPFPQGVPDGISLECPLDAQRCLVSNLLPTPNAFAILPGATVVGLAGNLAASDGVATLGPFETALLIQAPG